MKATTCAMAVALALGLGVAAIGTAADGGAAHLGLDPLDPLVLPAVRTPRAAQSVLVAITRAGDRLIAVGEGGIVLTSDDDGKSWAQAEVPVSVTLTSVQFVTPSLGWAVGHSGVVLSTVDGGRSWSRKFDGLSRVQAQGEAQGVQSGMAAGGASDPLLDIHFLDAQRGFAVGAFGLLLRTKDGGTTWVSWEKHLPNPDGNHLYGVRSAGDHVYVVGERGSIYASRDRGETFTLLKSPYEGSFFGLTVASGGTLVVYGLRGRAFASEDQGDTWHPVDVVAGSAWTGAAAMPDRRLALVGQAGDVAVGEEHGRSFEPVGGRRASLSAAVANRHGDLVAVGPRGVLVIDMSSLKRQQGGKS
jgi:photosystem II stability/assembly factor-like uncharacterized protein